MYVIFFLLLLSSCTSCADINDGLALLKIKEQLGNPEGLSTWVEGFDFCNESANTWASHIECTSTGRVRSLRINNMREISAPFPKAICDLAELEALYLELLLNLFGPIHSCIDQLSNLETVSIYRTGLSGYLPQFINHRKLTKLILSRNGFFGSIPSSLSAIPTLNYFRSFKELPHR
ncbi:hypothetical protein LUZ61_017733 [Rhynchospora tenuis]|uniref:Leucine-rich repeat-containing N-terminal plant-type domain-containing protein n=1 Tax=Rhynchospora tenuis TaxID=198213 RepID=A0AAD5Z7Y5_9POAL|nr:hypothetical protein LUZ61_017733 [Rhynchospora tenuis]